ncbi:MAG TPA: cytochrome C oxidase subunit IV family protein, partial [Candidatus Eisenbacteria bacterium]|nr:cytochrome C oxidase subunit IV family protein [Candidatus Eisenbacteria bacterium]
GHDDAHGSGRTHHPHVLPVRIYAVVAAALLVLTVVTVKVSYYNFGVLNLVVAMGVATLKASLVVLFFMHLKYDEKFNAIIFAGSLTFLTIFFVLTLADTMERGRVDAIETHELVPVPARPELVDRRAHPPETAQPGAHGLPATGDSLSVPTAAESAAAHGATAPGESTQVPGGH